MNPPFYSVIILTHNRSALLRESIQSVLNQTFDDFELIIIDDRSTDNTAEVVASYEDKRIKYFVNDRSKGQAGARNAGISRASGKWVAFLDDDDIWLAQKLEKQYMKIQEADSDVGIINTGFAYYDFENKKQLGKVIPEKEGWIQKDLLYGNCMGAICTVAVRNDLFKKVGGYDERFQSMVDLEMWVRIAELSKVISIKEILVYIRKSNSDRISSDVNKKLQGILLFKQKYAQLLEKSPKLCHRIATITLMYSLKISNWSISLKCIPWTLAGILFDPYNFSKSMWGVLLIITKSKRVQN